MYKHWMSVNRFAIILSSFFLWSCGNANTSSADVNKNTTTSQNENSNAIKTLHFRVTGYLPHDVNAFTEGLFIYDGEMYESTGAPDNLPQTRSLWGIVDRNTGVINAKAEIDRDTFFGEGIIRLGDKVYQLTYLNQLGFIWDAKTGKKIGTFNYPSAEGWGFTTDGSHLIMSDGTDKLTFLSPEDLSVVKQLSIKQGNSAVNHINELEYVDGFIYANIWMQNTIVKIDLQTAQVVAKMDISSLVYEARQKNPKSLEANGIAYDAEHKKWYVTGKMWPTIYELEIVE